MLRGNAIDGMVSLLQQRNTSLWHACNFQDFRAYLALGGIPSRAVLEQSGLAYTGFTTDHADHANGVWDKVFVNLSDFGAGFASGFRAVPNAYGPIVLQIRPEALNKAVDVAVCLRSAGAHDFDRAAEALPSVEFVDKLFRLPTDCGFPASAEVRYPEDLAALFGQAKPSNPEISCSIPCGRISLDHVVAVWTDPYVIAGKRLSEWVYQATQWRGLELRIRERSCRDTNRSSMYQELAKLVTMGCRSLAAIEQSDLASKNLRDWAAATHERKINYNFERYADYLYNGTLQPLTIGGIPVMPAPTGDYGDRLRRLLTLKRWRSPEAIGEVIATLADSNDNIRWLAGSVLISMSDEHVAEAVQAFALQTKSPHGRKAARDWLARIDSQ